MGEPDDEIPDEIAAWALADCERRGWIRKLGGGRFEITDEGWGELFEMKTRAEIPPSKFCH